MEWIPGFTAKIWILNSAFLYFSPKIKDLRSVPKTLIPSFSISLTKIAKLKSLFVRL